MNLINLISRSVKTGAALTATTTAAIVVASQIENGAPFGALNAITHVIDGDEREFGDDFSPRDTLFGIAVSAAAMGGWAVIYELLFGKSRLPRSIAAGAMTSLGAYVIDYYVVPKQYTPGIEKKVSGKAIFVIYVVLAMTLALSHLWNTADE